MTCNWYAFCYDTIPNIICAQDIPMPASLSTGPNLFQGWMSGMLSGLPWRLHLACSLNFFYKSHVMHIKDHKSMSLRHMPYPQDHVAFVSGYPIAPVAESPMTLVLQCLLTNGSPREINTTVWSSRLVISDCQGSRIPILNPYPSAWNLLETCVHPLSATD